MLNSGKRGLFLVSRLTILTKDKAQVTMESMYQDLERRIVASPPGLCPVDLTRSFIKMCLAQSCGKCVPCRVGLRQLARLLITCLMEKQRKKQLKI